MTSISNNSAQTTLSKIEATDEVNRVKEEEDKKKPLPSLGEDKFASTNEEAPVRRPSIMLSVADKMQQAGLNDDQINEILDHPKGERLKGILKNPKYTLVKKGESTSTRSISPVDLMKASSGTPEDLLGLEDSESNQKALEAKFLRSTENREMELVSTIVAASAFPTIALRSLTNIAGSLKSPAAKQMANSFIGQLTDFAKEEALKLARTKGNSDEAKELLSSLSNAIFNLSCSGKEGGSEPCEDGHIENLTTLATNSSTVTHTEEFAVVNAETGETAIDENGNEMTFTYTYEEEHSCEEVCIANDQIQSTVSNATDIASSTVISAEQEKNKFNEKNEKTALDTKSIINVRHALNERTNPNEISRLTAEERKLSKSLGTA